MPSPVEALPWGSRSTTKVGSPTAARAVPRLIAVVVLPTPPFWLATTSTRGRFSDMGELPNLQDRARRIAQAWMLKDLPFPGFARLRQFEPHILSLREQANGPRSREMLCIVKKSAERCAG